MELHEIINGLNKAHLLMQDFNKSIDIPGYQREIEGLEQQMLAADFWDNSAKAKTIIDKNNAMKSIVENYQGLQTKLKELMETYDLVKETNDADFMADLVTEYQKFENDINKFQTQMLLADKNDSLNAIVEIHPGAGGTESQDWAAMLLRMYSRFCDKKGWSVEIQDYLDGDVAGLKSVTFLVKGYNAYGMLKSEKGIHRLVRLSPFDSAMRRHTSFASVDVIPEFNDDIKVDIDPNDLRIDTYRASGAGGQHINKTDSAIRITHLPTNIVVTCQSQRSQIQNREQALKTLKSKLYALKLAEQAKEIKEIQGEQKEIAWGSQIRSYVLHPYSLVKDYRCNYEANNPKEVLDGELDELIDVYLRSQLKEV